MNAKYRIKYKYSINIDKTKFENPVSHTAPQSQI